MRVAALLILAVSFATVIPTQAGGDVGKTDAVAAIVMQAVRPVMERYGIPGMAVGVTIDGRHYVYDFGVASKATGKHVDASTLFEIGSITKTFTGSLASYAELTHKLSLSDTVSSDLPSLRGTSFDHVTLVNLATYTAGGLPLQFPDDVANDADAMKYYERWKPSHVAGTYRLYSNPSIMLLGVIAATRMGAGFEALMKRELFTPLGLHSTVLTVTAAQSGHYAQGYTDAGRPKRMIPGPLAAEAYGIRTTASDMLRFIDANLDSSAIDDMLRRAIVNTHAGYYRIGTMTQDLVWEQYRYPIPLSELLRGNSDHVLFEENKAVKIDPPLKPEDDAIVDKTGSTNGFGAYVAFIPRRKTGIVLLANKSYPIAARVAAAYSILTNL
ncbi:MAG: beta-lactamase [Candidatus Eremiobacteraeota bacterium]|nr:beta-lactamase [Candidatus Eremiobacteraeota bacterium]